MAKQEPRRNRRTIGVQRLPKWAQEIAEEDGIKLTGVALADWYLTLQRGRDLATAHDLAARIDAVGGMVAALQLRMDRGRNGSPSIKPASPKTADPLPLREPWEEKLVIHAAADAEAGADDAFDRVQALIPKDVMWKPGADVTEGEDTLVLSVAELDKIFTWLDTLSCDQAKARAAICAQARGWRPNPDQAGSLLKSAPWLTVPTKNPQGVLEGNLRRLSILPPESDPHGVVG